MTEPKLKLIETTISETMVRMRYADDPDTENATQWIEFQAPLLALKHPTLPNKSLDELESQFLAEVQLAALRYVRGVIGDETQRLSELAGRIR